MIRRAVTIAALLVAAGGVHAQDLLIRNATVHTATSRGTLQNTDVLVRNGRISAIGSDGIATRRGLWPSLYGASGCTIAPKTYIVNISFTNRHEATTAGDPGILAKDIF